MSIDALLASLPALTFDEAPAISEERFLDACGGEAPDSAAWRDLETQLRNVLADLRGAGHKARLTSGLSVYWRERMKAAYREPTVMKRETAIDRVFWDAAGELTPPASPLSRGALATYYVRLKLALKRARISQSQGLAALDALLAGKEQ